MMRTGNQEEIGALQKSTRWHEEAIKWLLFTCAVLSIITTLAIIFVLCQGAYAFFTDVSVWSFLTGTEWSPQFSGGGKSFGVLPLVSGTLLITAGSSLIAVPIGLTSAIYLSEYASDGVRDLIKPALEILAGIPSIVYGYFALSFVTPIIETVFPQTATFNAASACVVVGIMILPMVTSLSEDALQAVPDDIRKGAYALGASQFEVSVRVVVPAALSGILASFILAMSRAIGETMAVTLAAGMTPRITINPLESIQTMTAYIVGVTAGDTPAGSVEYQSLFAVGLVLFAMTLVMNLLSQAFKHYFQEEYE